jgi:hypothetical protein
MRLAVRRDASRLFVGRDAGRKTGAHFSWRRSSAAIVAVLVLGGAPPAFAQLPLLQPTEQPGPFVREVFASPYGRALVAELGKSLRTSADPACLQSKNLAGEQLTDRGAELIVTWGARAMETLASLLDAKVHETKFTASAGPNAVTELVRLRENEDVKRYLAIERPWRLAKVADFILEQFDRYALLARLKLTPVSPLASGNADLMDQNPADSIEEALDAFRDKNKSDALERYLALEEASGKAVSAALKPEAARAGPATFFRGIEDDLAALCIVKR